MRFSPLLLSKALLDPLKYFFGNYGEKSNFTYNADPRYSKIEIGTVNDFNKIVLQAKPRILLDRGEFAYRQSGLTDSMASGSDPYQTKGLDNRRNLVFIDGTSSLLIEARNEGTCELLADMVSHFLIWSRPYLSDSLGFKNFAASLQVSQCSPSKEDTEIFQVSLTIPWSLEEMWQVNEDSLKLKTMAINIAKSI